MHFNNLIILCLLLLWGCGQKESSLCCIPKSDPFFILSDGTNLKSFDKENLLERRTGVGKEMTSDEMKKYWVLKKDPKTFWSVRTSKNIILGQHNEGQNVYGASVTKAVVAAAALNAQGGKFSKAEDWQKLYRLLVNSDNDVWNDIQNLAGGVSGVNAFTKSMGYAKMKADRSQNQINAEEFSQFLVDVVNYKFVGAEALHKVMSACNTGESRARKFTPKAIYLGGKTGTWDKSNHDGRFIFMGNTWWSVVVFTELGNDNDVAILFGGLFREYLLH